MKFKLIKCIFSKTVVKYSIYIFSTITVNITVRSFIDTRCRNYFFKYRLWAKNFLSTTVKAPFSVKARSPTKKKKLNFFSSKIFQYLFFSKVFKFTWKMWNMLNRKKKQISDFYFSSYGHFCTQITLIFDEFSR